MVPRPLDDERSPGCRPPARRARLPRVHADRDAARGLHANRRARGVGRAAATTSAFEITASSYLRHMVRTLVGTMLELEPADDRTVLTAARAARPGRPRLPRGCTSCPLPTTSCLRSIRALPGRPLRSRRHRHRLRRDHPRLDAPCDARGARQRVPRRGADAGGRRARARGADAGVFDPTASTSSSPSTARTTSRCTRSSRPARAWRTCSCACTKGAAGSAS